ncbi:LysR family transcriptional regulator [Ottowia thiooxydans]|uniref:LysR family transcriptional regulator n=1 Tax=Ottowia thiooxydans TaxID=219182 RepID=UPI0003F95B6C|nr:LysR family transcriptional regulator [Ottowia thiooxydans]
MPINELRSISTFVKTADLGSLRQAAAAQGMSPQAASQALAQLEKHLGVRLFHRTTRNMQLTAEGQAFLEAARPSLMGLERALAQARNATDEIAGPLRIVGPHSVFRPVLALLLQEFCDTYPLVQPDVKLDDRLGNWVEDRVDVGFRIGPSAAEGVIARRLFPLQVIICAAPRYLEQHGAPDTIEQLANHRCSVFRNTITDRPLPWRLSNGDTVIEQDVPAAFYVNEEELETDAVLGGRVLGHLTAVTAAAHIRAGRLVPLLTQHVADYANVFVYYGSRISQPTRVRAFIDLAIERLANNHTYVLSQQELTTAEERGRALFVRKPAS